jgi:hypothetical protein
MCEENVSGEGRVMYGVSLLDCWMITYSLWNCCVDTEQPTMTKDPLEMLIRLITKLKADKLNEVLNGPVQSI